MAIIVESCACSRCQCEVDHQNPETVKKGDRYYCSQSCASGHAQQAGCGHSGCACYNLPEEEPHRHSINEYGVAD